MPSHPAIHLFHSSVFSNAFHLALQSSHSLFCNLESRNVLHPSKLNDVFCTLQCLLSLQIIGLARTIYIRCAYGIFGREITIYTVIYGVYIRFWPTLQVIVITLQHA